MWLVDMLNEEQQHLGRCDIVVEFMGRVTLSESMMGWTVQIKRLEDHSISLPRA